MKLIYSLIAIGILISLYATYSHYQEGGSFCDISETVNCDVVNRGPYSEVSGVPVALLGLAMYLVLLYLYRKKKWNESVLILTLAALYTLYLTYLEIFVIKVICPLCVANAIVVFWLLWIACEKSKLSVNDIKKWIVKPL